MQVSSENKLILNFTIIFFAILFSKMIILQHYLISMNTLQTELQIPEYWGYQHFHRLFIPREDYSPKNLCALLGWKIFTITHDGVMHSSNCYIEEEKLISFLEGIATSELSSIILSWNSIPHLPSVLSKIFFSNLTVLQLSGNKIYSIQGLQRVSSQHLSVLVLSGNLITQIKVLRKMNLLSLQSLDVSRNFITEISEVIILMNSPNLSIVEASQNKTRSDNLTMIMKCQSKFLKRVDQSLSGIIIPNTIKIKKALYSRQPNFRNYIFT